MIIKKFILVLLVIPILHIIKLSSAINYILIGTRIMKIGLNPELINSAGFWSKHLLWNKPTIKESYADI